jgi:hypothetical protein
MWPVGLSVEVAEQIRSDLRDMARARRLVRIIDRVDRLSARDYPTKNWTEIGPRTCRRVAERQAVQRHCIRALIEVCRG